MVNNSEKLSGMEPQLGSSHVEDANHSADKYGFYPPVGISNYLFRADHVITWSAEHLEFMEELCQSLRLIDADGQFSGMEPRLGGIHGQRIQDIIEAEHIRSYGETMYEPVVLSLIGDEFPPKQLIISPANRILIEYRQNIEAEIFTNFGFSAIIDTSELNRAMVMLREAVSDFIEALPDDLIDSQENENDR